MVGEGGVVAAVVGVEDQGGIQRPRLQLREFLVLPQQIEDVLRHGQLLLRLMEEEVASLHVAVGQIAVNGQLGGVHRQLQALAQDVGHGDVVGLVVVAVQGQQAARQRVHHVAGGGFHHHIPHEILGQMAIVIEHQAEFVQLRAGGKLPENEQIHGLLKAEPLLRQAALHQLPHVVAAIVQHALTGDGVVVVDGVALDLGDAGKAGQHATAVGIPQAALDIVFLIQRLVYAGVFAPKLGQPLKLGVEMTVIVYSGGSNSSHRVLSSFLFLECNYSTSNLHMQ